MLTKVIAVITLLVIVPIAMRNYEYLQNVIAHLTALQ